MKRLPLIAVATALAAVALPASLSAHRMWIVPSTTIVSGEDGWVTFDAAASNDVFFPDHQPLRAEPSATAPDGSPAKVENFAIGKNRATFDLHLSKPGTWVLGTVGGGVGGSYVLNGKEERLPRGTTADKLPGLIPAGATDIKLSEMSNRNEVFVTLGAPTDIKTTGKGLELVPVTHPNDLVVGEPATFGFTVDGKPAAGLTVLIVPGGLRYRTGGTGEISLTTDAKGQVTITWPGPGMYWLNTTAAGNSSTIPNATRRFGYTATLEVLPG
ncbi:DUF4198 domain-containing protein [Sphingomonas sp.]|uniref:DUF4198 domain-containing protein n=1 Tax=Sphingomonas sp. TaxID=28214 RepID=UPI002B771071|nr:DUF4198 domain-containing protein [Sphingomonas sp.]HWK34984.1 DUF4198 domain-containing protein [Sphingomonas sp.]